MKCPRCDAEVSGRFCGFCGGALEPRRCPACTAQVPPGHRFCSECGAEQATGDPSRSDLPDRPPEAAAGARAAQSGEPGALVQQGGTSGHEKGKNRRNWWIGGGAAVAAIALLTLPYLWSPWPAGSNGERVPMGGAPPGGSASGVPGVGAPGAGVVPAPNVDLSTMSPREAADRLFNRVMAALSSGDTAEVEAFLPMAIDAYHLVPELDADGHFHLSLLQQSAGDHQAGLESARRVLATQPDHLLALYAAGEAARELGRNGEAREHFTRLLEVFDQESARPLPEYQEHAGFLPSIRETARRFVTTEGG